MPEAKRASDYTPEAYAVASASLLHVATVLGDLFEAAMVVGGLVPSLITPVPDDPAVDTHVGTTDVDIALSLAVLDAQRYHAIAERMRRAGFAPDVNERGNATIQRWVLQQAPRACVDFLIPQASRTDPDQRIHHLESDFGALVTRGLSDAIRTRLHARLDGRTLDGAWAERDVWVCGPEGFLLLKALAFRNRGEGKDAYDLYYVLKHHDMRAAGIGARFRMLRDRDPIDPDAIDDAIRTLREDFAGIDGVGPTRAANFLATDSDDEVRADVVAHVVALLRALAT